MKLMAEGICEELPDQAYRLVRNKRHEKKVVVFGPVMEELGWEMLAVRPSLMLAIPKAKNSGHHVVVTGFRNRHPLYAQSDEFWGLKPPRSGEYNWNSWYLSEIRNRLGDANICTVCSASKPNCPDLVDLELKKFSPLPEASLMAKAKAKEIVGGKRFVTICPRKVDDLPRQLNAWQELVDTVRADSRSVGLEIISTTPKANSAVISGVTYLQDLVGLNDLLDVELALHAAADCCITTNTGAAGIMIYAKAKSIVILGGTGGHPPGWDGMRDLVAKENAVKPTRLILVPGNSCDMTPKIQKEMAIGTATEAIKVLWPQ